MSQSKKGSLAEAVFSTVLGLCIASVATMAICVVYDIPMTWHHNFIITFWMTIVSVIRSYAVRRLFNSAFWKRGYIRKPGCNCDACIYMRKRKP